MAVAANALTSLAQIQDELSNTNPVDVSRLERLINVASEAIESYCCRPLAKRTGYVERLRGSDSQRLVLAVTPLASITSIVFDGTAIGATEYAIEDAAAGFVWNDNGWPARERTAGGVTVSDLPNSGELLYVVTYTGGWVTPAQVGTRDLPWELEQACIDTVISLWRRRGADKAATVYDGENQAIGRATGGIIPGPVLPTLQRYKRLVVL